MSKRFKISVVIPVYNVQDFLEECIDSVINQSIGFECIQIILVNDGSADKSGEICTRYQSIYPDNIIYIEQDNRGVSAARNKGLERASGDLITFLDGDDKWSGDSFKAVHDASLSHPDAAVFSSRMEFFGADSGPHQLNYKYACDKLVDITKDYNYPQMSSSSVFIRRDLAKQYRYKENVKYSEDCLFINEILLDATKYMALSSPVYMYRRRDSGSSAMQRSTKSLEYYNSTCEKVYLRLFNLSCEKYGEVIPYIQFCVMYDLRWRLKIPLSMTELNEDEANQYVALLKKLLSEIADPIILEQKRIPLALQLYALELKYGNSIQDRITADSTGVISYISTPIFDISKQTIIRITSVSVSKESVDVFGEVNIPFSENRFELYYYLNKAQRDFPLVKTDKNTKTYLYGVLRSDYDFSISIPHSEADYYELRFEVCFDSSSYSVCPKYSTGSMLDRKNGFVVSSGLLACRRNDSLIMSRSTFLKRFQALSSYFLSKLNIF